MKRTLPPTIEVVAIACPLCGSERHTALHAIQDYVYGLPGHYNMVRCVACEHIYLNPRPSDASLMDCYPAEYAPYHAADDAAEPDASQRSENMPRPPAAGQPAAPLRRIARSIPGLRKFLYWLGLDHGVIWLQPPLPGSSRLLEIGCADGQYLQRMAELGWIVDGIEPSSAAARLATARGLDVQNGLFSQANLESASRDAVVYWMVLEHVTDPRFLLSESLRVLKPGGQLAFSVPNGGGIERHLFGKYWLGYEAPRHLQVFTARQIQRLLEELGFEQVRILHQANLRYWWGSVAAWGQTKYPGSDWPRRWMHYFLNDPPAVWRWALYLPAKLLSGLRCSGRITVLARKPVA